MHVQLSPNLIENSTIFSSFLVLFNSAASMDIIWLQKQLDGFFFLWNKWVSFTIENTILRLKEPFIGFKNKLWGEETLGCWAVNPATITHVFALLLAQRCYNVSEVDSPTNSGFFIASGMLWLEICVTLKLKRLNC